MEHIMCGNLTLVAILAAMAVQAAELLPRGLGGRYMAGMKESPLLIETIAAKRTPNNFIDLAG